MTQAQNQQIQVDAQAVMDAQRRTIQDLTDRLVLSEAKEVMLTRICNQLNAELKKLQPKEAVVSVEHNDPA